MSETAVRLGGWLLVGGSSLLGFAIVKLSLRPVVNQQFSRGISVLMLISAVLLLLSLPAMYAAQSDSAGWLGLTGFALLQAGVVLFVLLASTPLLYPSITIPAGENAAVFLLGIALTVGLVLTGIATVRAGVFPRWSGITVLAAAAGFFFLFFIAEFLDPRVTQVGSACFGVLLAVALASIGVSVWRTGLNP